MNIYRKEVKRNMKPTIIWTLAISLLNFLQMAVYPSMKQQTKALEELLAKLPKELTAAFGMDRLSMTEIMGYYGSKSYSLLLLLGGIFSMLLLSSALIKEKDEKTIEFLLSKPVTRNEIISEKLFAGLTHIILFNGIVSLITYISFEAYRESEAYDVYVLFLLCLGSFILDTIFGLTGFLLSAVASRGKTAMSVGIGIVLVSYFAAILASSSDKFNSLKYITPFKFVEGVEIILNKQLNATFMMIAIISAILLILATYTIYNAKDISV